MLQKRLLIILCLIFGVFLETSKCAETSTLATNKVDDLIQNKIEEELLQENDKVDKEEAAFEKKSAVLTGVAEIAFFCKYLAIGLAIGLVIISPVIVWYQRYIEREFPLRSPCSTEIIRGEDQLLSEFLENTVITTPTEEDFQKIEGLRINTYPYPKKVTLDELINSLKECWRLGYALPLTTYHYYWRPGYAFPFITNRTNRSNHFEYNLMTQNLKTFLKQRSPPSPKDLHKLKVILSYMKTVAERKLAKIQPVLSNLKKDYINNSGIFNNYSKQTDFELKYKIKSADLMYSCSAREEHYKKIIDVFGEFVEFIEAVLAMRSTLGDPSSIATRFLPLPDLQTF